MDKKTAIAIISLVAVLAVIALASYYISKSFGNDEPYQNLSIVSWNLKIFGDAKASNPEFMSAYAKIITMHDIAIIQEIRDSDASSFFELCNLVNAHSEYRCLISSRAGSTSSKEQYGIFVRNTTLANRSILIINITDYNVEPYISEFERPPYEIELVVENYSLNIITIHTRPENVPEELSALESLNLDSGNSIIIGDLNADCSYYARSKEKHFSTWNWIISDDKDTTTGKSNCAYDRIIANKNASREIILATIYNNFGEELSDHYPIAVFIQTKDR